MSPSDYLLNRRFEQARRLLTETNHSIGEIAAALGFYDSSHFARHFQQRASISPAEFRSRNRSVKSVPNPS
jgi:AraC family transcriptional regulator